MLNIVIFGAPGSGKGTQSKLIIEKYGLHHISTGDILRKEIEDRTALGAIADQYISQGQLVPDRVIIDMMADVLNEAPDCKGYIFDGFPRTIAQAQAIDELLRERNAPIIAVLTLLVEDKTIFQRLLKRAKLENRTDDTPETIEKRLTVYREQTEPLKEYYKKVGKLFKIQEAQSAEEVFEQISEVIDRLLY
ncbi:MAG: adenylate kinase [Dysgonamonadaceae bacterium]|jgi:adenylate kinase|nr:adenylate kinase [Dysgonamonadaceae bacterium]